jgi:hypothetical protein
LDSPEFQENKRVFEKIKSESLVTKYDDDDLSIEKDYATPWLYQLKVITLRTFRSFWHWADYGFAWVASACIQKGACSHHSCTPLTAMMQLRYSHCVSRVLPGAADDRD